MQEARETNHRVMTNPRRVRQDQLVQDEPEQRHGSGCRASTAGDDIVFVALSLPEPALNESMQAYFDKCMEKLGFIPNVLKAYAFDMAKLEAFVAMYNDLMLGPSGLSKLEREMIAVAVSSQNRCYYCLVAHGAAVRQISGDPALGELMVMNYRAARLSKRQRAMLDFAVKLTEDALGGRGSRSREPAARGLFRPGHLGYCRNCRASSTCRTGSRPRPTCGRTASITGWRGNVETSGGAHQCSARPRESGDPDLLDSRLSRE